MDPSDDETPCVVADLPSSSAARAADRWTQFRAHSNRPSAEAYDLPNFPTAIVIDATVAASDVRAFCTASVDRNEITCFRCGETGHRKNECLQWKTRLCWHHANMRCFKESCPFAHGEHDLRTPWVLRCIRIIKHGSTFRDVGCGSTAHSFRNCPRLSSATVDADAWAVDATTEEPICTPCGNVDPDGDDDS